MQRADILCLCLCSAALLAAAEPVAVDATGVRKFSKVPPVGVHPRVLLSPEDIGPWREHVGATARGKQFFGKRYQSGLIDELAAVAPDIESARLSKQFEKLGWEFADLLNAAMDAVYHRDDAAARKTCLATANFARLVMARAEYDKRWGKMKPNCNGVPGLAGIEGGLEQIGIRGGETFALAYDLLYNDMTPDQRDLCRKALALGTRDLVTWGMGFAPGRATSNWVSYHGALPLMFWAIEGEEGFRKERLDMFLAALQAWFDACLYPGGGGNEDGYMANTGLREGTMAMIGWARRGHNLFHHAGYRAYWRWMVQSLVPAPAGAWGVPYACNAAAPYESMPMLSRWAMPGDPLVNYYFYRFKGRDYKEGNSWQYSDLSTLLAMDWEDTPTLPLDPAKLGIPLTDYFPELGLVTMRSDWSDTALMVNCYARQDAWQNRHEAADRGRLALAAGGRLWIGGWWSNFQGSQTHALVHIDGQAEQEKAPNGNVIARGDGPLFAAAAFDLKRPYDWQWRNSFICPGPGWEPETSTFTELGWVWPNPAAPKAIFGADDPKLPRYGFTGHNFWRKLNNPVLRAFRSAAVALGKHPYALVIDDIQKDETAHRYESYFEIFPDVAAAPVEGGMLLSDGRKQNAVSGRLYLQVLQPAGATVVAEDYEVPGHSSKQERHRRIVVRTTAVAPDFKILFAPVPEGERPPVARLDAATGKGTVEWPDQKDVLVFAPAKEGFTQLTVTRDGKEIFGGFKEVRILPSAKPTAKEGVRQGDGK